MKQLSSSAQRLLELARGQDEPDDLARNRVARALSLKIATGVGAMSAGAAVAKTAVGLGAGIAAKSTLVVTVTGALVTAGWLTVRAPRPAAPAASAPPQAASLTRPAPTREEQGREKPSPVIPPPETIRPTVKAAVARRAHSVSPPEPSAPVVSVAEDELRPETEALRLAQQALRDNRPLQALKLLEAQDGRFPNGLLNQERSAMRVLALCQAGRVEEARAQAVRFEQSWPRSALLGRVRSACWAP